MKKVILLLIMCISIFSCTKKKIDVIKNDDVEIVAPQNVVVYFSTQNESKSGSLYLYTVKNNDTILNFSNTNTPYYLQLWYASTLPNGWNTNYAHLDLMTETNYLFGVMETSNTTLPKYHELKNYKFHIKDTLQTGVISIFVNN